MINSKVTFVTNKLPEQAKNIIKIIKLGLEINSSAATKQLILKFHRFNQSYQV